MAKDKDWGAPMEGGNFNDAVRYRGRDGWSDIILIVSDPKATPRHWTGKKYTGKNQRFYLRCLEEGPDGECCKEFGPPSASNTAYIIHVAEREGDGKWNVLGVPKVWGFGEKTRKKKLHVILRDSCKNDKQRFHKTPILVNCVDAEFQDLSFMAYSGDEVEVTKEMVKKAIEQKQMFADDVAFDREDILGSLSRLSGDDSPEPESEAETDKKAPGPPAEGERDLDSELDAFVNEISGK